jgi:hypothetical protein
MNEQFSAERNAVEGAFEEAFKFERAFGRAFKKIVRKSVKAQKKELGQHLRDGFFSALQRIHYDLRAGLLLALDDWIATCGPVSSRRFDE